MSVTPGTENTSHQHAPALPVRITAEGHDFLLSLHSPQSMLSFLAAKKGD